MCTATVKTGTGRHWDAYELIVLDRVLAKANGYTVLRTLPERQVDAGVDADRERGGVRQADAFDVGADDYLTEPFGFVVLLAWLRAMRRRCARDGHVALTVGGLSLDPITQRVIGAATPSPLTSQELAVLAYLMRHPDHLLRKAEIFDNVLGQRLRRTREPR